MKGKHIQWDDEWILKNWSKEIGMKEFTHSYNLSHKTDYKEQTLRAHCYVKLGLQNRDGLYSDEQIRFIKENYPIFGSRKCAELFNKKFGTNKKYYNMINVAQRHGLSVMKELKGKLISEANGDPIGTLSLDRSTGTLRIKTEEGYKNYLHELYGKPSGTNVYCHLDGNPLNTSPENIVELTRAQTARMSFNKFWSEHPEITKTGIKWCELYDLMLKQGYRIEL